MTDRIDTPTNRAQLNEMAWALANGMSHVADLERAASALLGALDAADRDPVGTEAMMDYVRGQLEQVLGHTRRTAQVAASEALGLLEEGRDLEPWRISELNSWADVVGAELDPDDMPMQWCHDIYEAAELAAEARS